MKRETIAVTEFKAKCLSLLNEVERTGKTLTITRRGRAVAKVEPIRQTHGTSFGRLAHLIECVGSKEEIINFNAAGDWDIYR